MLKVGSKNLLKVEREVDFGMYLATDEEDILIPKKYIPEGTKVGDELEVFVYTDSEDRLIATTLDPLGFVGEFAALQVKDVTDFGAFLDWGLEKDLLVPNSEQHKKLVKGQKAVVKIALDERTNRVIGISKLNAFFNKDLSKLSEGQLTDLMVYDETDLGFMVLIDNEYSGMLYHNEVFEHLKIGDIRKGKIRKVREDGKIDVRIHAGGVEGIDEAKNKILQRLKEKGGFLPYHDKSDAEEITIVFQMSKKTFKKAIGGLYKESNIVLLDDGIKLND